jgi:hypothetical protein
MEGRREAAYRRAWRCGGRQLHVAIRRNTDLLRESRPSRYSRRKILKLVNFPG